MKNAGNESNIKEKIKPYSSKISRCSLCSKRSYWFRVPENDWYNAVPKGLQKRHICFLCYNEFRIGRGFAGLSVKDWTLKGKRAVKWGKKFVRFEELKNRVQ